MHLHFSLVVHTIIAENVAMCNGNDAQIIDNGDGERNHRFGATCGFLYFVDPYPFVAFMGQFSLIFPILQFCKMHYAKM